MIAREEDRFRQTLERGSALLDAELDSLEDDAALDGDVAFVLHDTYGFPLEVTREMAELRGAEVDVEGFEARHGGPARAFPGCGQAHRGRSR